MPSTAGQPEPSLLLSIKDAARLSGVGAQTMRVHVRMGVVPSVKIGRRRLIPRSWLEELIAAALKRVE